MLHEKSNSPIVQMYSNPDYSEVISLWAIHTGQIPKVYNIQLFEVVHDEMEIDLEAVISKLVQGGYSVDIWGKSTTQTSEKTSCQNLILCVNDETAFYLDEDATDESYICFRYSDVPNPELYNKIADIVRSCAYPVEHSKIPQFQLVSSKLEYTTLKINSNKVFNIPEQFNDDFLPVDQTIQDWINNSETNGIAILHGLKGTGKSSYIEYLITTYYKKTFLYVTKETVIGLLSNSLFDLIRAFRNKIVIFEDCEQLIQRRTEYQSNSFISTLLNLSDGILASSCACKFILTFNCRISEIDDALLRKGRCIANYEFKQLEKGKTALLLDKLGKKYDAVPKEGLTLADIFNYEDVDCEAKPTRKIGFTQ